MTVDTDTCLCMCGGNSYLTMYFFSHISQCLPEDSPRAYDALYAANEIINICNPFDASTFPR